PDKDFIAGYWPKMRIGDNIESIYWLYNRTGDAWLLDVAKKVHEHGADWVSGVPNWHGVNLTEGFREPATYWLQTHDLKHLQATKPARPALPDQRQHGAARSQKQSPRHRKRRNHVQLQSLRRLPLLPAQPRHGLALLRRRNVGRNCR